MKLPVTLAIHYYPLQCSPVSLPLLLPRGSRTEQQTQVRVGKGNFASLCTVLQLQNGRAAKGLAWRPLSLHTGGAQGRESLQNVLQITKQGHGSGGPGASGLWPVFLLWHQTLQNPAQTGPSVHTGPSSSPFPDLLGHGQQLCAQLR